MSNFVDFARIEVQSGKGGPGCVSFRREKYAPRGGPDGGDGGEGGSVYIKAEPEFRTLLDYKYKQHFKADNGQSGSGRQRHGRKGRDLYIPVPVGTVIMDSDSGEVLADLDKPHETILLIQGGRGGKGNAFFVSSTHQAPKFAQPGEPAELKIINLELKLLADIGLVGFPNAGKSTLISAISEARPKIAGYPFTTLVPHLGVVRRGVDREFVVADIPGIIEDSWKGKGLGGQFLRHIERSALLLILVDVSPYSDQNPADAPRILMNELNHYQDALGDRVRAVVATKIDIIESDAGRDELREIVIGMGLQYFEISAATQKNLKPLLNFMENECARSIQKNGS